MLITMTTDDDNNNRKQRNLSFSSAVLESILLLNIQIIGKVNNLWFNLLHSYIRYLMVS